MDVNTNPLLYCKRLNNVYNTIFELYADQVIALHNQQFKEEDVEGFSKSLSNISQYTMANGIVQLFYRDWISGEYSFAYLKAYYKIDELISCFRCARIDLTRMFELIGININPTGIGCNEGIESVDLEHTFQIEVPICGEQDSPSTGLNKIDLPYLLAQNFNCCTLLI